MRFPVKFDSRSPRHCAALLLVLFAVFGTAAELSARYVFPRISRVYHRIELERRGALDLKGTASQPAVLLVGNSLFQRGIDVTAMQQDLPGYKVKRYVVSDTWFLDWYYGLQRLFGEGARPQVVVVGLTARQLIAERMEGDVSAHVLIRTADVIRIGRDLHKDSTALSNLYFANLSAFYGGRTQFRKWLLKMLMPDVETLGAALRLPARSDPIGAEAIAIASQRLDALKKVCAGNGAELVFVIPPTGSLEPSEVASIQEAGRRVGVPVLSPIRPGELGPEYFRDGAHLTETGAARFTSSLSSDLKRTLSTSLTASLPFPSM